MNSPYFALFYYFLVLLSLVISATTLTVGYYEETCPSAETIVRRAVEAAIARDPGLGAGLIRLHFHDCFVRGCDASVLLDSIPGVPSEKEAFPNNPSIQGGLRGFEVVDEAKALVESQCPSVVSCADILAFAARDSAHALGRIDYAVPAGRRDGRVSNESDVEGNLPSSSFNVTELEDNFARKGLSLEDMVTLSGAHSVGRTRCGSFADRLYSYNATHEQDPSLDPALAAELRGSCPEGRLDNRTAPLDSTTPDRLDNVYYTNLFRGKGVLPSDQVLVSERSTVEFARVNAEHLKLWATKFADAMVKMGGIEVISGGDGEIRRTCNVVNS